MIVLQNARTYIAPSRMCGELLGLQDLWRDWGLTDHAEVQRRILRDYEVSALDHDREVVDQVLDFIRVDPGPHEMTRYHWAMGAVSQLIPEDIAYFVSVRTEDRDPDMQRLWFELDSGLYGLPSGYLQWAASPRTMFRVLRRILEVYVRGRMAA